MLEWLWVSDCADRRWGFPTSRMPQLTCLCKALLHLGVIFCAYEAQSLCHCGLLCLSTLHIYLAAANVLGSDPSGGCNEKLHHIVSLTGREKPKGVCLHWHGSSNCHLFKLPGICPAYTLKCVSCRSIECSGFRHAIRCEGRMQLTICAEQFALKCRRACRQKSLYRTFKARSASISVGPL